MSKTPEMESFLDQVAKNVFGNGRTEALANNKCVDCGGDATEFRDEISAREYRISGFCQKCQDAIFGGSEE